MVAIVSGAGLGLANGSLNVLGPQGALGPANQGRAGERVYVNSSTGNLVVQNRDELVIGRGPDISLVRTYNSQGLLNDDNGDNWRLGVYRRVYNLSGTVNTAGSAVTRVAEDASESVYTYNAAQGKYVNNDGAGAFDTLSFDSGTQIWTWTDGDSRITERYDAANGGRIAQVLDPDGNPLTFTYNAAGLITQVDDANGETTFLDYVGNLLVDLRTVTSTGQTLVRTRYAYDNAPNNRLIQVTTDLSPEDASVTDGKTYVVNYTYDGTSKRIATLTQTDGNNLSFTYVQVGADWRVASYTDATGKTTNLTYTQGTSSVPASASANNAVLSTTETQTTTTTVAPYYTVSSADTWASITQTVYGTSNTAAVTALQTALGNPALAAGTRLTVPQTLSYNTNTSATANNAVLSTTLTTTTTVAPYYTVQSGNTWTSITQAVYGTSDANAVAALQTALGNPALSAGTRLTVPQTLSYTPAATSVTANANPVALTTPSAGWSGASLLETSATAASLPRIGFDGAGNAVAVWVQGTDLLVSCYTKATGTWSATTVLDSRTNAITAPQLYVDASGNAIATWVQSDGVANSTYVNRYANGAWQGTELVETATVPIAEPAAAINANGQAAVVWRQTNGTIQDLYANRYAGGVWSGAVLIEARTNTVATPGVAIDAQGNIQAIWQQSDGTANSIYTNRYTAGTGWSGASLLETSATAASLPRIGFDGAGNAIAVWVQGTDLLASRYTKTTGVWSASTVLDNQANAITAPQLYVDASGNAIATWAQSNGTAASAYVNRYVNGAWQGTELVETATVATAEPAASINASGQAAVAWRQTNGTIQDLYANRYAGGVWSGAVLIEARTNTVATPGVAIDAQGNVQVIWQQSDGTANSIYTNRYVADTTPYYAVLAGDTWSGIAQNVYGDSAAAGPLQTALGNPTLAAGMQLAVPASLTYTPVTAPLNAAAVSTTQTNTTTTTYLLNGDFVNTLQNWIPVNNISGATGSWTYYAIDVPAGQSELFVSTGGGTGDADLVVRYGALPDPNTFDAISNGGTNDEAVLIPNPAAGRWYVGVIAFAAISGVQLQAHYQSGTGGTTVLQPGQAASDLYGISGSQRVFSFNVSAGTTSFNLALTGSNTQDADLYLRFGTPPTSTVFDFSSTGFTANESVVVNAPQAGTWFASVLGFSALYTDAALVLSTNLGTNTPPTVDGGAPQSATPGAAVTLAAIGSDAEGAVTYQWTQIAGPGVILANAASATASFTAPNVSGPTLLDFQVRVTDSQGASNTDVVHVLVGAPSQGYVVQPGDTWSSIATALYGSANVADELQAALGNPALTAGSLLAGFPGTLTDTVTTTITVPPYYTVQASDTWTTITQAVYGTSEANAVQALSDALGNPVLTAGAQLTMPSSIRYAGTASTGSTTASANNAVLSTTVTTTTTVAPYYTVSSIDTWTSITQAVYGTSNANAVAALQTTLGNPVLSAGLRLTVPQTLSYTASTTAAANNAVLSTTLTTTTTTTVAPYYSVQAGDTWSSIAQSVYGDAQAGSALQTALGNPALTAGLHLTVPQTLGYNKLVATGALSTDITTPVGLLTPDPLGLVTTLFYDASGQIVRALSPAVGGTRLETRYTYDASGNVTQVTDARGNVVTYGYDASGNRILDRDAAGDTVTRTYGSKNELLSETAFAVPDPDGAGVAQPASPLTTRYVYSATNHLRFVVSAEGLVTEYRYNGFGQRVAAIQYTGNLYTLTGLNPGDALTEAQLTTWVGTADKSKTLRADSTYDFRGQVASTTIYASVDAAGNGVVNGTESVTQYIYDQAGNLLKTVDPRGVATPTVPNDFTTTHLYDGLGRLTTTFVYNELGQLLTTADAAGRTTFIQYDDANRKTTITLANGLVTTSTYDAGGHLISVLQSANSAALGITSYFYDTYGRLRRTEDPTGVKTHILYDELSRKIGEIDGTGSLTEYRYDANSNLTRTIRYATAVSAANLASLADTLGKPTTVTLAAIRPAASDQDRNTWNAYDSANRLVKSVDELGFVTQRFYDGASRLTDAVRFASAIATAPLTDTPTAASIAPASSGDDRLTRNFYDGQGKLRGTLDGEGFLSEYKYDAAGQLSETVGYATATPATPSTLRTTGTLAQLIPTANDNDIHSFTLYNAKGQVVGVVDGESYLTEYVYDTAGNKTQSIRYATRVSFTPGASIASIRPVANALDQVGTYTYTALNQLASETNPEGTLTQYTYDEVGNLTQTTKAVNTAEVRTLNAQYDKQGRLTALLNGNGSALLTGNQTQAQIDAIWAANAIKYTYDAAGRRTSTTDANGNKTLFYYDADGQLTHAINAAGEVQENRYNALGQLTRTIAYGTRLSVATLGTLSGGLVNVTVTSAVAGLANAALDSITNYNYTTRGQVASTADPLNLATSQIYNAFGEAKTRSQQIGAGQTLEHIYTYDKRGLLTQTVWDPTGINSSETTQYDAFGRAIQSTDANGNVRTRSYDRLGRVVTTVDPTNANRVATYDAFARVLTQRDALNNTTTFVYSNTNRSVTMTTPEGIVITTVHNRFGQTQTVTDGRGGSTQYTYDQDGNLKTVTDALGQITTRSYDKSDRLIETTDARGVKTAYTYDAANRVLTRRVDPTGLNLTTTYAYDAKGQTVSVTDANGTATQTLFDLKGQVTSVTVDPGAGHLNLTTTYAYDGKVSLTVTEGAGSAQPRVTQYTYDKLGRRTKEQIDPTVLNLTTSYAYDKNNNAVTRTDALGNLTRYVYDADDRLAYTVDPLGGVTENGYDAEGRIVRTVTYATPINLAGLSTTPTVAQVQALVSAIANPAKDALVRSVLDGDGRTVYSVSGVGSVTQFTYDANGNVIDRVAYANAIPTSTAATIAAVSAAVAPLADPARDSRVRTVYDALDRAILTIDGTGAVTKFTYDGNGNVVDRIGYAAAVAPATPASAAALAAAVLADPAHDSHVRMVYDAANRLVYNIDGIGAVTQNVYDANGNVIQTVAFAAALGPTQLASLGANPSIATVQSLAAGIANAAQDQVEQRVLDADNRLIYTIDALGSVEKNDFDALGQVTRTMRFAQAIPAGTPATLAGVAAALAANVTKVDTRGLSLVGTAGDYASTPDTAANSVTGDLDLRAEIAPADWTPAVTQDIATKWQSIGINQRSYILRLNTTGGLTFIWSPDGVGFTTINSTAAVAAADGAVKRVRAVLDVNNGAGGNDVKFYTSDDGVLWTQLGATVTTAGTTGIFDSTAPLVVGQKQTLSTENPFVGKIYYAEFRNGIDGAVVAKFNPSQDAGSSSVGSFTSSTGEAWTLSGSATLDSASNTQNQVDIFAYDATGRRVYSIDGTGAVTQNFYDANGNVIRTAAYATALNSAQLASLGSNASLAAVQTLVNGIANPAQDRIEQRVLDSDNRLVYKIDALGFVEKNEFDALGHVTRTTRFAQAITIPTSAPATLAGVAAALAANAARVDVRALNLPGTVGSYASTPATAANSLTGDIDVRVSAAAADWTPATDYMHLVGKWDGAGGAGVSWYLAIRSSGQLYLQWMEGGITRFVLSTVSAGIADGARKWVRATLDVNNGAGGYDVKFYLSDDYNPNTQTGTWTQLGSTVTNAGITSIADSPGAVTVGTRDHGVAGLFAGTIYYADVRNGIDGTVATKFNPSADAGSSSVGSFTSSTGEAWTLSGSATLDSASNAQNQFDTFAYDAAGHPVFRIDAAGAVTQNFYDANGNVIRTVAYATALSPAQLASLGSNPGVATVQSLVNGIANPAQDRAEQRVLDADGRLVYKIDALGFVEKNDYDAIGQITRTTRFARAIPAGMPATLAGVAAALASNAARVDTRAVTLPGTSGSSASTPDTAANSVTGDIDLRVVVAPDSWASSGALITKDDGANVDYGLGLSGGRLQFVGGQGFLTPAQLLIGTVSTVALGFAPGSTHSVRVTRSASTGDVKFYTSEDYNPNTGTGTWTQLGATARTTLGTSDNGSRLRVGARSPIDFPFKGKIYYAEVRNGIDGAVVAKFNPSQDAGSASATSFTSSTGELWSLTGAAALADTAPNQVDTFTYDAGGRVIRSTDALGSSESFSYDALGHARTSTNKRGFVSTYAYDAAGRIRYEVDAAGDVTEHRFDAFGQETSRIRYADKITVAAGAAAASIAAVLPGAPPASAIVEQTNYDNDGRVFESLDGNRAVTRSLYDAFGERTDTIAALGLAEQRTTHTVYDLIGRLVAQTSAYGAPEANTKRFRYDAFGNEIAYVDPRGVQYTTLQAFDRRNRQLSATDALGNITQTAYDAFGNVVKAIDPNGNTGYFYFDALNRVVFQIDPEGDAIETRYDFEGKTVATIKYANKVQGAYNEATRPLVLAAAPVTPPSGPYLVRDNLEDEYTLAEYDALGRSTRITDAEFHSESSSYDAAGNLTRHVGKNGNVCTYDYDALNRKIAEHQPITSKDSLGNPVPVVNRYEYDALGNKTKETLAQGLPEERVTQYVYDKDSRLIETIEPSALVQQASAPAQAGSLQVFAGATANYTFTSTITNFILGLPPTYDFSWNLNVSWPPIIGYGDGGVKVVWKTGSAFGDFDTTVGSQVTSATITAANSVPSTDPAVQSLGSAGTFEVSIYKQSSSGDILITQATGSYSWSTFGFTSTAVASSQVPNVLYFTGQPAGKTLRVAYWPSSDPNNITEIDLNSYAPGTFAGMTQGVLSGAYGYEAKVFDVNGEVLNFVTGTFSVVNGVVTNTIQAQSLASGVLQTPHVLKAYDAVGNVIRETDAKGNVTFHYYDAGNRLIGTVNAERYLRRYFYDAAGNVIAERTYGDKIPDSVVLTTLPDPATIVGMDAANFRETDYRYNANNLLTETDTPAVLVFDRTSGLGLRTQVLATQIRYDRNGNRIVDIDANGNKITSYYDKAGRKTAEVDALKYLTTWAYDAAGNVLRQTRYATVLTGPVSEASDPAALAAQAAVGAKHSDDRVCVYAYDRMDRMVQETTLGVSVATVNATTVVDANGVVITPAGAVTEQSTNVIVQKRYDAQGNLIARLQDTAETDYVYDGRNRLVQELDPSFTDLNGVTVRSVKTTTYDGVGNVRQVNENGRITSYEYDPHGNLTRETDPLGSPTRYFYDLNGNITDKHSRRTNPDGTAPAIDTLYAYDKLNRQISTTDTKNFTYYSRYDAYGEITVKGINSLDKEFYEYDKAGRLIRTNKDDGVYRVYLYDADGNETAKIQSAGNGETGTPTAIADIDLAPGLTKLTVDQIAALPGAAVQRTESEYDARNQLTRVLQAPIDITTDNVSVQETWVDALSNPFIGGTLTPASGGTASYAFSQTIDGFSNFLGAQVPVGVRSSLDVSWPPIVGYGDGAVKVVWDTGTTSIGTITNVFDKSATSAHLVAANGNNIQAFLGSNYSVKIYKQTPQGDVLITTATGSYAWSSSQSYVSFFGIIAVVGVGSAGASSAVKSVIHFDGQRAEAKSMRLWLWPVGGTKTEVLASKLTTETGTPIDGHFVFDWSAKPPGQYNYEFQTFASTDGTGPFLDYVKGTMKLATGSWQGAQVIDTTTNFVFLPQIASDPQGNAMAIWLQGDPTGQALYANRYVAATGTWQGPQSIAASTTGIAPQIALDALGNAIAVMERGDGIYANRYVAATGTWQGAQRLSTSTGAKPQIAFDAQGNAIAVWQQATGTHNDIYASRYVAATGTWQGAQLIESNDVTSANFPQLAIDSKGNAIVVWEQTGICANRYVAATGTWQGVQVLGSGNEPQIAFDPQGNAIAIWELSDGTRYNIWANRYAAATGTWQGAQLIETNDSGNAFSPQVALDAQGNAVAVWQHFDGTRYNIYANRYAATNGTWQGAQLIETDDRGSASSPQVVLDAQGNATAVWSQFDGTRGSIFANRYLAATGTWQGAQLLETDNTRDAFSAQIALDAQGNAIAVWDQSSDITVNRFATTGVLSKLVRTVQEVSNGQTSSPPLTIARSQGYNAFGQIVNESDNSGHVTDFTYSTRGDLLQKLDPATNVTLDNGLVVPNVRSATRYYYDYLGRAVAMDDANGNRNSQRYDAAGNLLNEYHADGGVKQYGYDVFGNKRFADNEIGERTWFTYDAKNQLTRVDHPTDAINFGNAARFDSYDYDEAGRRIRHTNALGAAELTYYDDIGRVKRTIGLQTAGFPGIVTQYRYVFDAASGGTKLITLEQTSQGTKTLEDTRDYFGRSLRHVDLGGHTFTYTYNNAGLLISQTGDTNLAAAGNEQNISFTYYRNGYLKEEIDSGINARSKYEYDQNGNRTFEGYAQATSVGLVYYQYSRAQYDELNRVVSIHDPKYDLSYEYDKNGNRRRAFARFHDGLNNDVQIQDYWYAYDSMNRFVVTKGSLVDASGQPIDVQTNPAARGSGTIVAGKTGTQIFYNRASERKRATYVSNGKTLQDVYDYAVDGLLTKATITDVTAAPFAVGSATRSYDVVGNVKSYQELNAANVSLRSVTYDYNANNTLKKETDSGSGVSNFEYDAAGSLLRVTNPQPNGTTVTTTYAYEYWDTAKQSQIRINAKNPLVFDWKPGFSNFIYDVNGHLTQVNDFGADGQQNTLDDRYLRYALDAEGKILQRNELKGSQSSKTQYYYYLNGIGIGDAGGFGPSQTDYVNVLASRPNQPSQPNQISGWSSRFSKFKPVPNLKDYAANPIGSADFDYNYMPINDQYPAFTPGTYTIRQGDVASSVEQTLRNVAMAVWGDGSLWYILADANGLNSKSPVPEAGQTLVVPNVVANIHNNASTFKVYNPGELIGDTTPTLPDPPPPPKPDDDRCFRIVAIIVVVVIAVVVSVATEGALSGEMEGWAVAAISAAAGSAAGQVTAMALGLREHFSWREVGTAALTAGLTYGIDTGNVVTTALLKNAVAQAVNMARNPGQKFDWAALAAAAINSYIDIQTQATSNATSTVGATWDGFTTDLVAGLAKGAVSQGLAILMNRDGRIDWANVAANALGSAIGNAIAADIPGVQQARRDQQAKDKQRYEQRGYTYEVNPNGSLRVTGISNSQQGVRSPTPLVEQGTGDHIVFGNPSGPTPYTDAVTDTLVGQVAASMNSNSTSPYAPLAAGKGGESLVPSTYMDPSDPFSGLPRPEGSLVDTEADRRLMSALAGAPGALKAFFIDAPVGAVTLLGTLVGSGLDQALNPLGVTYFNGLTENLVDGIKGTATFLRHPIDNSVAAISDSLDQAYALRDSDPIGSGLGYGELGGGGAGVVLGGYGLYRGFARLFGGGEVAEVVGASEGARGPRLPDGESPIVSESVAEEARSPRIGSSRAINKVTGEIETDHDFNRYRSQVKEYPMIGASAYLQDGELDISLRTYVRGADGSQTRVIGFEEKDQMQKIFDHFGSRVDAVRVSFEADNLDTFNRFTGAGGLSPEEAASTMLAGKRIQEAGFTKLSIERLLPEGAAGNYTKVETLWRR